MHAWNEWKDRCAAALCSSESQTSLRTFGGKRFRTLARRCLPLINATDVSALTVSDSDAWHLLEVHMTLPDAINGKAYKQWLFARLERSTDNPFDVVQGGATLLMRSVVREHLRSEYLPHDHLSLDQPPPLHPGAETTLSDLLPSDIDARSQVELRELEALATEAAAKQFACLSLRSRLALAARHLGIPFTDPLLLAHAACRRSALHEAYRHVATQTIDQLRGCHPHDDPATVNELALLTFEALTKLCLTWTTEEPAYFDMLSHPHPTPTLEEKAL